MKKVLTIAGTDPTGGAGVQADLKTMCAHDVYGMSVMTALVAQNTLGVNDILEVSPDFLEKQIDAVFMDIAPDAVKIGMVSNPDIIEKIVEKLKEYNAINIVVDPVMVSTSGSRLMNEKAYSALVKKLIPLARVITPNIYEAEILANKKINNKEDMLEVAKYIFNMVNVPVLLKGGHLSKEASDLLYDGEVYWFEGKHIDNPNTHGTGCTLSSAIACNLAKGDTLKVAIENAKIYITNALEYGLDIGKGKGPLYHMVPTSKIVQ
ncbi:MAG: bifunctional hydroxymethylpyrimidine kinase/phosphomethylpyrimidine kinase [Coprobacillaceae bacterium]